MVSLSTSKKRLLKSFSLKRNRRPIKKRGFYLFFLLVAFASSIKRLTSKRFAVLWERDGFFFPTPVDLLAIQDFGLIIYIIDKITPESIR